MFPLKRPGIRLKAMHRLAFAPQHGSLFAITKQRGVMRYLILSFVTALCLATPLGAQCVGSNLIAAMPIAEQAALRARTDLQPFAAGNYWRATRGDEIIHVIGTYHFDDPRHAATMVTLAPVLATAQTLLVEAGPDEEAALIARMSEEPELMIIKDGPTLPQLLPPADWQRLSTALSDRGIPPFMAAKFRPWYLSMMLSIPPCDIARAATAKGLDGLLIAAATAQGLGIAALEPYDTIFGIFDAMPQADQLAMITSTLALEDKSTDMSITLADAYFAEEGRLIWEFTRALTLQLPGYTPEQVEKDFAAMEQSLMKKRNRSWIPVIEAAAAKGPVLVAFGALHLSGDAGVLNLLAQQGYHIDRLPLQ